MKAYNGRRVFEGYAIAKVVAIEPVKSMEKKQGKGFDQEFNRFTKARALVVDSLEELYLSAVTKVGEKEAQIFNAHKMMAEDLDFEDLIKETLQDDVTAEFAVQTASSSLADMFLSMDDTYMKARSNDVLEVGRKIIDELSSSSSSLNIKEPCILICDDLAASDLMKIDHSLLLGIAFIKGSGSSHVSILTRMLEIPSISNIDGLSINHGMNGTLAILDGCKGDILFSPTSKEISKYNKLMKNFEDMKNELQHFVGKETITLDGRKTKIYSNIASSFEVESVLKNDAEGIGLFRSEFIYLESSDYPDEDMQFEHYKTVVFQMKEKETIIRTLDIGADKKVAYFNLPEEENPALGYRSIRICKDRPELFLTQLQALYRASVFGNLSVMIPMITSLDEIKFVKEMAALARSNLNKRKIAFNNEMKIGIMIETPAAAIMSDVFAKEVDFFSIGTNDLTQYTLAVDRVNPKLASTFDPHHKAILRLINMTAKAAHEANIPVGICGELARDKDLLPFFLKIGIDELSVSPTYVLALRKSVSEIDVSKVKIEHYL